MPSSGTGPFWSVIVPAERTNLIVNPSFEFGTANYVVLGASEIGTVSGTSVAGAWSLRVNGAGAGSLGNDRGVVYGTANGLDVNGTYVLSAYVYTTGGTVALYAGTDNTVAGGNYAIASGTQSGWFRLTTAGFKPTGGSVFPKVVAFGTAMRGTIYVDAVQLEKGTPVTTYIDGDQPGCSWNGLPQASTSSRSGDTRLGGQAVRFDDIGFTVDTSPGIGAPPFNTLSQSYAQLDGGEFQKQRKNVRRFTLTSLVDGTSWGDLHYQRRRLIEAIRIENTPTQQPMRLLYSGAGGTLAIDAVWDGGVQFGADGQSFAEGIVASFTAYDPDWKDTLQEGTTFVARTDVRQSPLMFRDRTSKWGTLVQSSRMLQGMGNKEGQVYAIAESLDGGTIYAGVNWIVLDDGITQTRGLIYFAGTTYGLLGNGTIDGTVFDLKWNQQRTKLYIGGDLGTIAGTPTGQLAFWNPTTNTYGSVGWVGTGTRFNIADTTTASVVTSILPWQPGTIYLGGHFHRVNSTLLGSNWNVIQFDETLGGWSAISPVSVTGTGFIQNNHWISSGSKPGVVYSLTQYDQNRILIGAEANTLRGFGTGIHSALYDVRGTWGTIPGFKIDASRLGGVYSSYQAPDRSMYIASTGTQNLPSDLVILQGLTANGVGTTTGDVRAVARDDITTVWVAGTMLDGPTPGYQTAIARSNGYDWQPADMRFVSSLRTSPSIQEKRFQGLRVFPASNGTTYFGFNMFLSGGASDLSDTTSIGTVYNSGMTNVYPIICFRNTATESLTSSNSVRLLQFANVTTNEYIWFDINILPQEVVTLITGPGRVAFQSNFRGDILSTVIAGSKLSSFRLLPGPNLISYYAISAALTADMYWNPRYHSADGTGIV